MAKPSPKRLSDFTAMTRRGRVLAAGTFFAAAAFLAATFLAADFLAATFSTPSGATLGNRPHPGQCRGQHLHLVSGVANDRPEPGIGGIAGDFERGQLNIAGGVDQFGDLASNANRPTWARGKAPLESQKMVKVVGYAAKAATDCGKFGHRRIDVLRVTHRPLGVFDGHPHGATRPSRRAPTDGRGIGPLSLAPGGEDRGRTEHAAGRRMLAQGEPTSADQSTHNQI